jgi:hypothetical protein
VGKIAVKTFGVKSVSPNSLIHWDFSRKFTLMAEKFRPYTINLYGNAVFDMVHESVVRVAAIFDHSFAPQTRFFRAGIGALSLTI